MLAPLANPQSCGKREGRRKDRYALDNPCCFACFVAIGTCHFLHLRWFRPRSVGGGHRHPRDPVHPGPKRNRLGIRAWQGTSAPALVLTRMHGPFGVVGGILKPVHRPGLVRLIRLGEFSDALLVSVCSLREPLGITRLPGAVRTCFLGIPSEFINLRLAIPQSAYHNGYLPMNDSRSAGSIRPAIQEIFTRW